MKRIIISFAVFTLLTIGTVLAAPETSTVNPSVQSNQLGEIDVGVIFLQSPKMRDLQNQINEKAKALTIILDEEKENLTSEEFENKKEESKQEFIEFKKEIEKQIEKSLKQAMAKVAKDKNLVAIFYKGSVAFGGIDVTLDVMNSIE